MSENNEHNESNEQPKEEGEADGDFVWIDGADELAPMYDVGDEVILYSPYTKELYMKEGSAEPELYAVTDVRYDERDEVFRYLLKDQLPCEWYSEDWLSLPTETAMVRDIGKAPQPTGESDGLTTEVTEAERAILAKWLDDLSREKTVDRCLAVLSNGNEEEKAEARQVLAGVSGE